MNGDEQRSRGQAVAQVASRQADVEEVVLALAAQVVEERTARVAAVGAIDRRLGKEHTDRVAAVQELRDGLLIKIADERSLLEAFVSRRDASFWARLRWLVTGR